LFKLEAKLMMPQGPLDAEFFARLVQADEKIVEAVALRRCPHCGGALHRADYDRKPRGGLLAATGEAFYRRFSLCCGREGCRKRTTPPSLRFLGRRVYLEAVVVLASSAAVARVLRDVSRAAGVPMRTLRRWLGWWWTAFVATPTWFELRARFVPPPPVEAELPKSLIDKVFTTVVPHKWTEAVLVVARLLGPLTTQSMPDGAGFLRGLDAA
jgi:hypothetical protein